MQQTFFELLAVYNLKREAASLVLNFITTLILEKHPQVIQALRFWNLNALMYIA